MSSRPGTVPKWPPPLAEPERGLSARSTGGPLARVRAEECMAAVVGSPSDPFLELLPTTAVVVRAEEGMVVASPSDPFLQQSVSQFFFQV